MYDQRPFFDAVGNIRRKAANDRAFSAAFAQAYQAARLPRMSAEQVAADPDARAAHAKASAYLSTLSSAFGRNGWDGKGAPLRVGVHGPNPFPGKMNESFDAYAGQDLRGADGKRVPISILEGPTLNGRRVSVVDAENIVEHEINHMVWDAEVAPTRGPESNNRTAVNEAWADALAMAFDDDWVHGEVPGVPGLPTRDLRNPTYRRLQDIPSERDFYRGPVREDYRKAIAGVLNRPVVAFADRFGREAMGQVWYRALVDHMPDRVGPTTAARATVKAAADAWGSDSPQVHALVDAWNDIGLSLKRPS